MSGLLSFLRRQVASYHLHSSLELPQAMGGLLTWREFEASQVGTWARAVQPLQVAHSPVPQSCLCNLGMLLLWKPQLSVWLQFSVPIPASAMKPRQQGEHCFGKKQGALT